MTSPRLGPLLPAAPLHSRTDKKAETKLLTLTTHVRLVGIMQAVFLLCFEAVLQENGTAYSNI